VMVNNSPISTKETITSHLKSVNTNKTATYGDGNPDHGLEHAYICRWG